VTLAYVLILLAVGAAAGFACGLVGVGGGFIMVPASYWVIQAMGVSPDIAIRIAFGTSLLVILPTALSGARGHHRRGAIHWRTALILGGCGLVGALLGASLAARLPGETLATGFGALLLAVALWMLLGLLPKMVREGQTPRENPGLVAALGFPVGVVTGLTGLGGGVLKVPLLVLILRLPMHIAVGTSVASIIFAGLGGIIGYIINGLGVAGLLPYSLGYVNLLPLGLCLVVTSIPMAQLGVRAAHALPARRLRYIFVAFMIYAGLRMVGAA
jgi:uncharacterized protein